MGGSDEVDDGGRNDAEEVAAAAAVGVEKGGREMCWDGCGRPVSVCVCAHLPAQPIPTSTTIIVLHHPHALRRNPLSTLPLLSRSLLRCDALPGRRLRLGSHSLLDSLYRNATDRPSAVFLLPGGRDLSLFATESGPLPSVLVVFDGTWRQAKEMAAASAPFLERFAVRVSLGGYDPGVEGPSTFESELVLRKEPFQGCVSTMEAVARALRVMEPSGKGAEVEGALLLLLRAMVGFQARHLQPTKPRAKLKKKKEIMAEMVATGKTNEKKGAAEEQNLTE
ncbi:tRNA-uridine aminocarboxypropyltransferase 2-like isoform X1 [Zingiber officinale]|uniref:tRNA-uridine aminocarboxypropyltransferase 2-like isoform X1 n=2 Tax=Zingiber officinale TaxID=94328 RepID=UPI001C4ACA11|nr:tRNA-uridine aminocarboxypropyltransferase 2-like isoform X1 [Zingiber officinale]